MLPYVFAWTYRLPILHTGQSSVQSNGTHVTIKSSVQRMLAGDHPTRGVISPILKIALVLGGRGMGPISPLQE